SVSILLASSSHRPLPPFLCTSVPGSSPVLSPLASVLPSSPATTSKGRFHLQIILKVLLKQRSRTLLKNAFRNRELTVVRTNINLYPLNHNHLTTISPFSYFVLIS